MICSLGEFIYSQSDLVHLIRKKIGVFPSVIIEGHPLNEAHVQFLIAREFQEIGQLVRVKSVHHHTIYLEPERAIRSHGRTRAAKGVQGGGYEHVIIQTMAYSKILTGSLPVQSLLANKTTPSNQLHPAVEHSIICH